MTCQRYSVANPMTHFGLSLHDFQFVFSSNIWPNFAALRDTSLQNVSDFDFGLSKSPEVKSNGAVDHHIKHYELVFNRNIHMP